jgi:2-hydroxychromene-2-carboxylate isomerase
MSQQSLPLYIDYKSPYAFLAKRDAYQLERDFRITLEWLPYTLHIENYLGSVEERNAHHWRRVRYSYMDARRLANLQGLTLRGPKRIFNAYYASVGMLFAQRNGFFDTYNDLVFELFFKRELNVDSLSDMAALIGSLGGDESAYREYAEGSGREEHDAIRDHAEGIGVFGVPTFVLNEELFWGGDRMQLLVRRLEEAGLGRAT